MRECVVWREYKHHVELSMVYISSRRRHTRCKCDWSSDVCSSDLVLIFCCQSQVGEEQRLVERDDQGPQINSSKALPPKALRRPRSVTTKCCLKSLRSVRLAASERSLLECREHLVERDDQGPQTNSSKVLPTKAPRRPRSVTTECCLKSIRVLRLAAPERSVLHAPEPLVERDDQGPQASSSKALPTKAPRRPRSVTTECCLKSIRVVRLAAPRRSLLDSPEHLSTMSKSARITRDPDQRAGYAMVRPQPPNALLLTLPSTTVLMRLDLLFKMLDKVE